MQESYALYNVLLTVTISKTAYSMARIYSQFLLSTRIIHKDVVTLYKSVFIFIFTAQLLGLINEVGCNPQITEPNNKKSLFKKMDTEDYGHLLLFVQNLPDICNRLWRETNIIPIGSTPERTQDNFEGNNNNNPAGSVRSPYMINLSDLASTLPRVYMKKSFKKPKSKTKMKDLTNIEWNDAEPDHPDVTFQSFVVTPTVIEIWNAMYRDGDTDLLDFIKDIKKTLGQ